MKKSTVLIIVFIILFTVTTAVVFSDQDGKKENNHFSVSPGFGVKLTSCLNVSGSCGFMMIFYDDAVYMGITPGIRVGFEF